MKRLHVPILMIMLFFVGQAIAHQPATTATTDSLDFNKPLFKPFIERYILDELKQLRQDNLVLRKELAEQIAQAKLETSDRAIEYTTSTINNIFYIITAAASLLVLLGWRSLNDIKKSIRYSTENKLNDLIQRYEERLNAIEEKMKERSNMIVENQEKISNTNIIHSLWMRAGIEKSEEEKISIYDEILEHNPDDVEAMTYKADSLLEINETRWALSLANAAIEKDSGYSLAYWQRACALAKLGRTEEAMDDIEKLVELSEHLRLELTNEKHFENLRENNRFIKLLPNDEPIS